MIKDIHNQDVITLEEPAHQYKVATAPHLRYTSATTFIGDFFNAFDADGIAEKLAASGKGKYANKTKKQVLAGWAAIADRGTAVHEELEDYLDAWRDNKTLPTLEDTKAKHGQMWIESAFETHFVPYTEIKLYSNQYQLAGTVDLLVHNPDTDEWIMADWKTNAKIDTSSWGGKKGIHYATRLLDDCKLNKYALQMSLYQYLLESEYGIKIKNRYLVHLRPQQTMKYPLGVKIFETPYLKPNVEKMLEERLQQKHRGELFLNPII